MSANIILTFGKYKGQRFSEVDPSYLRYLSRQVDFVADPAIPGLAQAYLQEMDVTASVPDEQHREKHKQPVLFPSCLKCQKTAEKDIGYLFRLQYLKEVKFIYFHTQCFKELLEVSV